MKGITTFTSEIIFTNNNNKELQINRNFTGTNLFYKETIPNNRVIANKPTVFINGIKCREATLDAYGRKWTAFYSEDYPFQLGPYLFSGLPGLIIKVEDQQKYFSFTLSSFKKENNVIKNKIEGKEVSKVKFYEMSYETDFSGSVFNSFSMENNAEHEALRKKFIDAIKKKNTEPIDKTMRYIFNK